MPERIDLRPGSPTRRPVALVPPRALVEVRGDILDAAGTTRPVAFGRRSTVRAGDLNTLLAEVEIGGGEPLTLEVRGTLQADRTLWAQAALTLGEQRIDAMSTVIPDGDPVEFDVELRQGLDRSVRAVGSISNREWAES